jgi:hypothetical protein
MSAARNRLLSILGILAFVAFLAWNTFRSQGVECQVCVQFGGRENCATASGPSEDAAVETAQTTACGPVSNGMDDAIGCGRKPPVTRQCSRR